MNQRKDAECMMDFLDATIVNGVQDPGITPIWEFLPRSAPLIDFLAVGLHSGAGWKYPSLNTVLGIQRNLELSLQMLKEVEVKEIVAGVSSADEIFETTLWMKEQFAKDQAILPTRVISMDVEEIRVTHYDWMKMTGGIPKVAPTEPVKTRLARDCLSGHDEDR